MRSCRLFAAFAFLLVMPLAPAAVAAKSVGQLADPLPAAGELVVPVAVARTAPAPDAPRVLALRQFRRDYRTQEVLAVGATLGADGRLWYQLSLPMRPNNTTGWVAADELALHHVVNTVLINIAERRLDVLRGDRVLFSTVVAVGRRGMETPTGEFYVQARFQPDDPFLGVYAFETSAYSKLTEWPGGGVVGIHGTSKPKLIGRAVSHGCVRVSNAAARVLEKLVPLGTPVTIVQS